MDVRRAASRDPDARPTTAASSSTAGRQAHGPGVEPCRADAEPSVRPGPATGSTAPRVHAWADLGGRFSPAAAAERPTGGAASPARCGIARHASSRRARCELPCSRQQRRCAGRSSPARCWARARANPRTRCLVAGADSLRRQPLTAWACAPAELVPRHEGSTRAAPARDVLQRHGGHLQLLRAMRATRPPGADDRLERMQIDSELSALRLASPTCGAHQRRRPAAQRTCPSRGTLLDRGSTGARPSRARATAPVAKPSPQRLGILRARPSASRSPRSPRTPGSSTTRSTASSSGSRTSSARAGTGSWWSRPSDSRELVARGPGARCRRCATTRDALFADAGCAHVLGRRPVLPFRRGGSVSLPLDVSRTLEDLLDRAELDFVHVHEPFAPSASSAALRHSRALNVGTFHSTTERFLSTQVARRLVELLFGRLDGRTASFAATRDLVERYFPGDYRVIRPGADLLPAPGARRRRTAGDRVLGRGGARRAAAVPARAAAAAARARLARDDLAARPGRGARPSRCRARLRDRVRFAGPARRLGGAAPGARARSSWPPRPARRPRRSCCCARWPAARCRWSRGCRSTRRRSTRASSGLLFEPRDADTLAAQLERLIVGRRAARASFASADRAAHAPSSPGRAWPTQFEALYERDRRAPPRHDGQAGGAQAAGQARASSTSTCTCTPTTRPTARPRSTRCSRPPRASGLGAIAVTDHNEVSGALEARERGRTGSR